MALANIAWILASNRYRVLVLDWDLEAPGLHRYFRPFLLDRDLTASDGIIDFVSEFAAEAIKPLDRGQHLPEDWYASYADILSYAISLNWEFPEGGRLDFIPAGRQVATYATRVTSFNWQNFYERLGGEAFIEAAKDRMRAEYDYILVDSRTGVSDTAGICTVQLPDILVACFTYNNQSLEGAAAVAESVYLQRSSKTSEKGNRGFRVFPVPMRVDSGSNDKLNRRKRYARRLFDDFLTHIPVGMIETYWNRVEVPYVYDLSYEESLATFHDSPTDPKTAVSALLRIARYLTNEMVSDLYLLMLSAKREQVLEKFEEELEPESRVTPIAIAQAADLDEQIRLAEFVIGHLPVDEERAARQLWTRLVLITSTGEIAENVSIDLKYLDEAIERVASGFSNAGLLALRIDELTGDRRAQVTNENVTRNWTRLNKWIQKDLEFLVWRQKLDRWVKDWEDCGRTRDLLLGQLRLRTAITFLNEHTADLSKPEISYINESARFDRSQESRLLRQIGRLVGSGLLILALFAIFTWRRSREHQTFLQDQAVSLNDKAKDRVSAGQYREAIDLYDAALRIDPGYVEGYDHRGNSYLAMTIPDYERAISDFKECIKVDSKNLQCAVDLSNAYNLKGDYDSALKTIEPIIEKGERNETILAKISNGNIKQGEVPVDRDFVNMFEPLKSEIYYIRGNIRFNKGDYGDSIQSYEVAIAVQPEYGNAYLMRSIAYSKTAQPQRAVSDFCTALRFLHDASLQSLAEKQLGTTACPP